MKIVLGGLVAVVALALGIGWATEGNQFFMYKVFAPQYVKVDRQTFEQSKSYNTGMVQELEHHCNEYRKDIKSRDFAGAAAVRDTVQQDYADFNPANLSPSLATCLTNLLGQD